MAYLYHLSQGEKKNEKIIVLILPKVQLLFLLSILPCFVLVLRQMQHSLGGLELLIILPLPPSSGTTGCLLPYCFMLSWVLHLGCRHARQALYPLSYMSKLLNSKFKGKEN